MTHKTHVKTSKSLIIKCLYRGHHFYKFSCSSAAYCMSYKHFCNTLFLFSVSILYCLHCISLSCKQCQAWFCYFLVQWFYFIFLKWTVHKMYWIVHYLLIFISFFTNMVIKLILQQTRVSKKFIKCKYLRTWLARLWYANKMIDNAIN